MLKFEAQALRRARVGKRITQAELGRQVGLSTASVCRIERGERVPSAHEVEALMTALGLARQSNARVARRDLPVVSRIVGEDQRLKISVEISLEESDVQNDISPQQQDRLDGHRPIVFYVPLTGLVIRTKKANDD